MRPSIVLVSLIVGALPATHALADTNYASIEAKAGESVRLTYHASAHKNCTAASAPTIKVTEPPKNGTLTVRKATLTTDKITGCPKMTIPANIIFYQGNEGYSGPDHVAYQAIPDQGDTMEYDVTITVVPAFEGKAPEAAPAPNPADGNKGEVK